MMIIKLIPTLEEEESAEDDYELKRREKGKHVEEIRHTPSPTTIRSPRIQSTLVSSDTEKLQELMETDPTPSSSTPSSSSPKIKLSNTNRLLSLLKSKPRHFRRYKSFFQELKGRYGYLFEHLSTRFMPRRKFNALARHLQDIMMESLPKMVDERIKKFFRLKFHYMLHKGLYWKEKRVKRRLIHQSGVICQDIPSAVRPSDQDDPHDDAHPEGENSAKRQKTSEHRMFVFGESSSSQDFESEPDDEVLPNEKVSKYLMDEMSQTVDEAKLRKVVDEMLRQQCTSGDEHQYHLDQMQNFLKCDIMWESRKEVIVPPYQPKPTPVAQSCQIDPKAPALSLLDSLIMILKKELPDGKQQEPRKPKEEVYSKSKIVQIIKTYWELGHEHKFITEIVARRENGCIISITESNYKNLNKNDIEDMYLNSKKEKRVMRHQEVHKFCDATLKRLLEGLKSYNKDVKYGYVTHNLSREDVEYLQLFAEEIEERLKYHDQMRRWEIYVPVSKRPEELLERYSLVKVRIKELEDSKAMVLYKVDFTQLTPKYGC
ncbi:hypothetical protein Tco_0386834 [Tanacetum coccineum]